MFRAIAASLALTLGLAAPLAAQPLGYGRLVNNDFLGDGFDRWQTGSIASSRVYGPSWDGQVPGVMGDLLELRLNAGIRAPADLQGPHPKDRPYAGSLSFGLHTHFQRDGAEVSLGADLVFTGPRTGLGAFQTGLHDALGVDAPAPSTLDRQISNGIHPTLVAEVGHDFALSGNASLRPFVEGRAGDETLVRAGLDLTLGTVGQSELLVRDPVTGQRYRVISQDMPGLSLVLGGDIAQVESSIYLPESRGYRLTDSRSRLRAGLHWQGARHTGFYGLTWLGEEFEGQPKGQVVGSLRLKIDF